MRWLIGFVLVLAAVGAVRLVGCGETTVTDGDGGNGGTAGVAGDGYVCRSAIGEPGAGGGGYYPPEPPGVYSGEVQAIGDQLPSRVRFETSSDCTALVPSTECTINSDNTEPAFFEIEFEGLDEQGERCGGAIAVTAALVTEVPIENPGSGGPRFTIDFTDDDGAEWFVDAWWGPVYGVHGSVRRTQGDTYCQGYWFAEDWCMW